MGVFQEVVQGLKEAVTGFLLSDIQQKAKPGDKGIFGWRADAPSLAEHMEHVNAFESYMVRTGRWDANDLDLTTADEFQKMARANTEFAARKKAEQAERDKTMTANAIAYATGQMETPVPPVPTVSMHYHFTPIGKKL